MDKGKRLEKETRELFKNTNTWFYRFYDTRSARTYLPPQPADFMTISEGFVGFVECKEHNGNLLPISCFRPQQLKTMRDAEETGYRYNVFVLRDKKLYYLISGKHILEAINRGHKSIDLDDYVHYRSLEEMYL